MPDLKRILKLILFFFIICSIGVSDQYYDEMSKNAENDLIFYLKHEGHWRKIFEIKADTKSLPEFNRDLKVRIIIANANDEALKIVCEHYEKFLYLKELVLRECYVSNSGLRSLNSLKQLDSLVIVGCPFIFDKGISYLSKLENLESLTILSNENISDKGISELRGMINLKVLNIDKLNQVNGECFEVFKEIGNLEELRLSGWNIDKTNLIKLEYLTNLKILNLILYQNINLEYIKSLKNMSELREFSCSKYSKNITNLISSLPKLKKLNLSHDPTLKDDDLSLIWKLKNLESLNLSGCMHITDESLDYIKRIDALKELRLTACRSLSEKGIDYIGEMTNLEILDLSMNPENDGLKHLVKLENLKILRIFGSDNLTSEGLKYIGSINNLELLDISGTHGISADDLSLLTNLKNLKLLDFSAHPPGDINKNLKYLELLPNLEVLDISFCGKLDETGYSSIEKMKKLRKLYIENRGSFKRVYKRLNENCPNLEIIQESGYEFELDPDYNSDYWKIWY
jgi:hypothetical protein